MSIACIPSATNESFKKMLTNPGPATSTFSIILDLSPTATWETMAVAMLRGFSFLPWA